MASQSSSRSVASLAGVGVFVIALILIGIAFSTPYWLTADDRIFGNNYRYDSTGFQYGNPRFSGLSPTGYGAGIDYSGGLTGAINPLLGGREGLYSRFENLGLWAVCYRPLTHPYERYESRYFSNCRWLLSSSFGRDWGGGVRSYYLPDFFVATQVLFTSCFVLLIIALILVCMHMCCFRAGHGSYVTISKALGGTLIFSALLGILAVIVFGAMGTSTDWVTQGYDYNYLSWSFGLAVVGVIFELIAGALFIAGASSAKKQDANRAIISVESKV